MVHVTFEIRAVEDRAASLAKGAYCVKDADFALFRTPGDKHTITEKEVTPQEIDYWKSREHLKHVPDLYTAWKKGLEEPVNGIGLREWPIISPAQLQQALAIGIRTVEDFANLNDEGLRAFGLGGQQLKAKAKTYLESAANHGKVTEEVASLKAQVAQLMAEKETKKPVPPKAKKDAKKDEAEAA